MAVHDDLAFFFPKIVSSGKKEDHSDLLLWLPDRYAPWEPVPAPDLSRHEIINGRDVWLEDGKFAVVNGAISVMLNATRTLWLVLDMYGRRGDKLLGAFKDWAEALEVATSRTAGVANILYTATRNERGRSQDCVFATCVDADVEAGPIWGHGPKSVLRALFTLNDECSCGIRRHHAGEA